MLRNEFTGRTSSGLPIRKPFISRSVNDHEGSTRSVLLVELVVVSNGEEGYHCEWPIGALPSGPIA